MEAKKHKTAVHIKILLLRNGPSESLISKHNLILTSLQYRKNYQCPLCHIAVRFNDTLLEQFYTSFQFSPTVEEKEEVFVVSPSLRDLRGHIIVRLSTLLEVILKEFPETEFRCRNAVSDNLSPPPPPPAWLDRTSQ